MIRSILRIPQEKLKDAKLPSNLTTYEGQTLKDLVEILTPLESATQCIQGEKILTGSMVIPCIRVLKSEMSSLQERLDCPLVKALKGAVERRLSTYEDKSILSLASSLGPRFKLDWCSEEERTAWKSSLMERIIAVCSDNLTPDVPEPTTKKTKGFFSAVIPTVPETYSRHPLKVK